MAQKLLTHTKTLFALVSCLLALAPAKARSMELFQVKLVEQDSSTRLIATSNYNYAIVSPKLAAKSWRTASVNGDKVLLVDTTGRRQRTTRTALGADKVAFLEKLRDEVANSNGAYSYVSTASGAGGGSGGFMMSFNSGGMTSSSSMSSSSSFASSGQQTTSQSGGGGETSFNMRDQNNFSVSRSNFPFNWARVFINGELVTLVYRNGEVEMLPTSTLEPGQRDAVQRVRTEVVDMQRNQQRQISNTMQSSMDMVSNVFNNIMGNFG